MAMHDDELTIDVALVRTLVDRARPELAGVALAPLGVSGSSNALFRLGADLIVRLPRQPGGSATITKEARWLPYLASGLPVEVPEVVKIGEPGFGYPERWSIVRWIAGTRPDVPASSAAAGALARDLGGVVAALGRLPVPDRARADPALRWYRGEPLRALDESTRSYLDQCATLPGLDLDVGACLQVWDAAMALADPDPAATPHWLHGDLLAENLLVRDGRLAAVLDFGGLAVGDPTVDLVVAWELLDAGQREVFRSALDVDEPAWLRGRAWALAIALMTFPYYWSTMPERCSARLAMARAVLQDAGLG